MKAPPCADECREVLREHWAIACRLSGGPLAEVHITYEPPLGVPVYPDLAMMCPHGVVWHLHPPGEQVAKWAADGVE